MNLVKDVLYLYGMDSEQKIYKTVLRGSDLSMYRFLGNVRYPNGPDKGKPVNIKKAYVSYKITKTECDYLLNMGDFINATYS